MQQGGEGGLELLDMIGGLGASFGFHVLGNASSRRGTCLRDANG